MRGRRGGPQSNWALEKTRDLREVMRMGCEGLRPDGGGGGGGIARKESFYLRCRVFWLERPPYLPTPSSIFRDH
jgi:hypothetical protein